MVEGEIITIKRGGGGEQELPIMYPDQEAWIGGWCHLTIQPTTPGSTYRVPAPALPTLYWLYPLCSFKPEEGCRPKILIVHFLPQILTD